MREGSRLMSTPIYRNEEAWRAHMMIRHSAIRHSTDQLSATIVGALVVYLISTYSVPVALGLAACWMALALWVVRRDHLRRRQMLERLNSDPELDL
jgi:hypothetical protein